MLLAPLLAALLSVSACPAQAAGPAVAKAPASLDELLEPLRAKHDLPALAGAIVSGSELIALGAVGERERGSGVKVTTGDQWHLGSCTKALTATLAARLVEQGKLKWSTTVAESFPEWKESMNAAWRDVPLEWFLQNRGGAPGHPGPELWSQLWQRKGAPHEVRRWYVEQLLAREPEAPPGTKFVYSNQGFTIAGAMLEQACGKSWEELLRAEVFTPLGMVSGGFGPPGSADAIDQPRGHAAKPVPPGPGADNPAAIGPAGTVHVTLADWAKFAAEHLRGALGTSTYLKPESFVRLHSAPAGQSYAMGWGCATRPWAGGRTLSHSGSNTMWYCSVWIAPEKDVAFLVASNCGNDQAAKACDEAIGALVRSRGK